MPLIVYVTRKRSRSFQGFLTIAEKVVNMLASKQCSEEAKNELFDMFVSLDSMMVIMTNEPTQKNMDAPVTSSQGKLFEHGEDFGIL